MLTGVGFVVGFVSKVLQLYEEMIGAEDVAETKQCRLGVPETAGVDEISHLAVTAAGEADEAGGVGAQRVDGDEWWSLAVGVGQMGCGEKPAEVGIPFAGLGEQHEVVGVVWTVRRGSRSAELAVGRDSPASRDSTLTSAPNIGLMPCSAQALAKRTAP